MSDAVAGQLVGDDHPRHILHSLEQPAEELCGGVAVSTGLDQHIEYVAVLVDRPPQVVLTAVDADEDLVEMPLVAGLWASSAQFGWRMPDRIWRTTAGSSRNSPRHRVRV